MAEQAGTFGSYIDEDIIKQIEVRQCLQGRKNLKGRTESFTERDYQALHNNAPWICLRSSVDAPPVNSWKPGKENNTTDTVARKYILCGGTLEFDGMDGDQPKLHFSGGPNISNNKGTPGYTKDSVMGYRPKPGITKVTVKTKDTFGCIMEADVDFMVYSIDELEMIDQIYFKPGMTALLEWGHTVYHDSTGRLQHMTVSDLYSFDQFFSNATFETIEDEVQNWRKFKKRTVAKDEKLNESGFCGNYEVLFGYITNFSYSFNSNGSYTCKVKILSKGSILEGLQIPANTGCKLKQIEEEDTENSDLKESSIKTPFHRIFNEVKEQLEKHDDEKVNYAFTEFNLKFNGWDSGGSEEYRFFGKNIIQKRSFIFDAWKSDSKSPIAYLNLDTFLRIVNRIIREAHIDYVEFDTRAEKTKDETGRYVSMPYVSFDEHFSLNPGVVVLPCRAIVHGEDYKTTPISVKDTEGNELTVNEVLDKTNVGLPAGTLKPGEDNVIADLWVNIDFILGIVDGIVDSENRTYSLKSLIENILEGIQKAMGNVNDFGVQFNEVVGKYEIVDRNCIASSDIETSQNPPIKVSGTDTTITDLSISSEVSSEVANSMAIAATAPNDGTSLANVDQVFWNEGCIDRHRRADSKTEQSGSWAPGLPERTNYITPLTQEEQDWAAAGRIFEKGKDFLKQVYALYHNFIDRKATEEAVSKEQSFGEFVESSFTNLQREGETFFKRCVNRDVFEAAGKEGAETVSNHFQSGIIPIKVGFTMKGIGRFIIGTTFQISEGLVPRKYKDWRNIITGVEHSVDGKGWKTTVNALYYPVVVKAKRPKGGGDNIPWVDPDKVDTSTAAMVQSNLEQLDELKDISKGNTSEFFKAYWRSRYQTAGACAKYVVDMARCFVGGQKVLKEGIKPAGCNAGDVYASTGKSLAVETVSKLGWKLIYSKQVQSSQIDGILRNLKTDLPGGSIVIYYMNYKPSKQIRPGVYLYGDYNGKSHYHIQMRAPEIGSGWTTSTMNNYGCGFVYNGRPDKSKFTWMLHILTPPEMHSDWKT